MRHVGCVPNHGVYTTAQPLVVGRSGAASICQKNGDARWCKQFVCRCVSCQPRPVLPTKSKTRRTILHSASKSPRIGGQLGRLELLRERRQIRLLKASFFWVIFRVLQLPPKIVENFRQNNIKQPILIIRDTCTVHSRVSVYLMSSRSSWTTPERCESQVRREKWGSPNRGHDGPRLKKIQ